MVNEEFIELLKIRIKLYHDSNVTEVTYKLPEKVLNNLTKPELLTILNNLPSTGDNVR